MKIRGSGRVAVRRGAGALVGAWRRSVQLRVVASTVVLSALAIGLTGWALLGSVAEGLAEDRRVSAVAEARTGFDRAQEQLDAALDTEPGAASQTIAQMVGSVTVRGDAPQQGQVVVEGPLSEGASAAPVLSSGAVSPGSVPQDLARSVRGGEGVYWRYSELTAADRTTPSVVVGSRLLAPATGDQYAMYYVFSLEQQQSTLALVRNALGVGGVVMVLLVGGVAGLVSRQVLDPVRLARRIAERFAAGNLEERMHVRGEDDIARLSTSLNQMASSLQTQIRRLENLSRLQQRFVSDVSHELRTPLTTVQMAGEVLFEARSRFDPGTARAAELLMGELDRFETLLSDLLDLSRFDAGAAQLELDDVDVAHEAALVEHHPIVQRKAISVRFEGVHTPAVVAADVRRVDRILRNLAANAATYSGSDELLVRVAQNDECVSVGIRDFGVGLSAEEAARVFDRFWRADPARAHGGTGLGLPISREDATLHGGTLHVWARPGQGTEFILTLPKAGGSADRPALVSELAPVVGGQGR
ncbi:ATPase/histidine kinase/DNA gyrase B/HSP90 domain protein [Aeromicrobium marinum DSM 15272]|uniref:Sensor histidine kinase MtrB n=1 Tax=Aeromicrobium marinum DSM 15272 TaxID=585531 RepID=E2SDU8_9ACTN|nr:MtrAB system histidine kinase MtrB [Aeromicrobium marinum]EFQ82675.1 ATPase/histidine kinase/DNA gyrase B/HSP90 domain protein [Aeromicrobium marinum DSM 15272]